MVRMFQLTQRSPAVLLWWRLGPYAVLSPSSSSLFCAGLVAGVFLLGFGLVEIPRALWNASDPEGRLQYLQYRLDLLLQCRHAACDCWHAQLSCLGYLTCSSPQQTWPAAGCQDVVARPPASSIVGLLLPF